MATTKSKSRARPSRNHAKSTPINPASQSTGIASTPIQDAIEAERARLMSAEAILHCVVVAMDESESGGAEAPNYQVAIEVARELVVQTIDQLDSVRVKPLLGFNGMQRVDSVKESAGEYLLH